MLRRRIPEEMDHPRVNEADHLHGLRSLNRVNRLLGINRHLAHCLDRFGPNPSILDMGCGGGGFLNYVRLRYGSDRLGLEGMPSKPPPFIGLDRSPFALRCARQWCQPGIHWIAASAESVPIADNAVDVVTCSLFLHHFDEEMVVTLLRESARVARRGVLVCDLIRSRTAWVATWLATRLLSRSRIFHVDGPRSVLAAIQPEELDALAQRAGMQGAEIKRRFPFRYVMAWRKSRGSQ